ncbi:MAG: hypothetical protein GEV12_10840 [Micromonosporaceae bacterium]|nr:hypothetical protein [Micromonosporaceae bacterium]
MTAISSRGWRRYPLVERVGYHLARVRAWGRRATVAGLAVRVVIWLTGLGGLLLALPGSLRGPALPLAVFLALLPAVAPASAWVALLELAAIGTVALTLVDESRQVLVPVLLAVAALLYAHHTSAALGAQLRTDTVVPLAVFRHWLARAGLVLAGSALLGLGIVVLAGQPRAGADTGYLALGAAATAVAAIAVGALVHRSGGPAGAD